MADTTTSESATPIRWSFGEFTLDEEQAELRRGPEIVELRVQSYEVLRYLVAHHGRLISRDALLDEIWGGKIVTEDSLTHCLGDIRRALGDSSQRFIRTVRGRGYIFQYPVTVNRADGVSDAAASLQPVSARWRWLGAAAVLVVSVLAVTFVDFSDITGPADKPDPSIAVLPFVNLSSDLDQAFFADGVGEEILNLLAKIPELRVISRTSSFTFRGDDLEIPQIAERLNVAHILEGSVRRAGNRIRVTAQLIEARSDTHLWSETFDRDLDDIFAIQDEIAARIVENLHVELVGEMPTVERTDPVAMALTIQAKQIHYNSFSQTDPTLVGERMAKLLDKALEIDPEYTPALAWYAYANWERMQAGSISRQEERRLFDDLARRALAIDPEQAMILHMMALDEIFKNADPAAAAPLYERALHSAPNDSEVLRHVGRFAYVMGRYKESLALLERSVELDPLCTSCLYFLSRGYMIAGELDKAEEARGRFLLLGGDGGYFHYGVMKLLQGDAEAALTIFEDRSKTDTIQSLSGMAMALHSLGRYEESDRALLTLIEAEGGTHPDSIAEVYAWRDDKDAAFDWLDKEFDSRTHGGEGFIFPIQGLQDPLYRNLHDDPRWEAHRARLGMSSDLVDSIEIDLSLPGNP